MGIVTKKGDKGITSLYSGERVAKDDTRVEAYGALDELCSYLGMSKSSIKNRKAKDIIESIQRDIFVLCHELATTRRFSGRLKSRIGVNDVRRIEKAIEKIECKNDFQVRGFCLPGENFSSAVFDVCRTVARRAERKIVTLERKGALKNRHILIYINRLSDLLYLLARYQERYHRKVKMG